MLHMPTTTPAPTTPAPAALPATAPLAPTWAGHEILDDPITAGVLLSVWSGDPAVVVPAPPGSGKSRLVVLLAATLAHRAGLRVGIAAQTRAQATELATRFNALPYPARLRWGKNAPEPDLGPGPVGIMEGRTGFTGRAGGVCIATTARWLLSNPHEDACDVMIVDEAWQATYADLGALGAFATQLVAVGDPGQIDPVVTGSVTRWADKPTAPHLPSPTALTAAHGDTLSIVKLRHTYRLGPATTALIQPVFYHLRVKARGRNKVYALCKGHIAHNSQPPPGWQRRAIVQIGYCAAAFTKVCRPALGRAGLPVGCCKADAELVCAPYLEGKRKCRGCAVAFIHGAAGAVGQGHAGSLLVCGGAVWLAQRTASQGSSAGRSLRSEAAALRAGGRLSA